ncbi:hypothetical protein BYT27DRAFT_7263950 [Phlegmacium glaucopus]|nr:hypothetical protein BYT27DRAFT_7263950 [Phlegmacium glaucopus]
MKTAGRYRTPLSFRPSFSSDIQNWVVGVSDIWYSAVELFALGVYSSSVVKDLICSPRPFAPNDRNTSLFPSTHCTNCISIALFFFSHLHHLASTPASSLSNAATTNITSIANNNMIPLFNATLTTITESPLISPPLYTFLCILLIIYTFSIVFSRLYTAMHSLTDCVTGLILGTLIWWIQTSWEGFPVLV